MASVNPAIGIDLGTVNSVVAICIDGKVEIIKNGNDRITPSYVFYDENVVVGNYARQNGFEQSRLLFDSKRFIGRSFDDVNIESLKKYYQFELIKGQKNSIEYKYYNVKGRKTQLITKTPEEVSAEILKTLKNAATKYIGEEVTDAVITVPAYFTNAQREATKNAANLAGLNVLQLLNEPTAAALYYFSNKNKRNDINALIFDLGGGTLDISIVRVENNGIYVKAVDGDTFLGGRNFDEQYYNHVWKILDLQKRNSTRVSNKVKDTLINIKENLSADEQPKVLRPIGPNKKRMEFTRTEFETVNDELFRKCIHIVERCLKSAKMTKKDIDEVVLVGGSTRIPKIQQMLSMYFDGKQWKNDLDKDEVVALGAAIQAAILNKTYPTEYNIKDVTPTSLGVETYGNLMDVVIKKNSELGTRVVKNYTTAIHNQNSILIRVYEGERKNVALNNLLGEFSVENITNSPAGRPSLDVTFNLNENSILEVFAKELTSDKIKTLKVEPNLFTFKSGSDANNNLEDDEKFEKFVRIKMNAMNLCNQYMLTKTDDENFQNAANMFLTKLDAFTYSNRSNKDFFNNVLKEFNDKEIIESIENVFKVIDF